MEYIETKIGKSEYKQLNNEFIKEYINTNTINGFHDKFYEFNNELLAIEHYLKKGAQVKRIKRKSGNKTPDLKVIFGGKVFFVECKFIHNSRPIKSYVARYDRMLGWYKPLNPPVILWNNCFHCEISKKTECCEKVSSEFKLSKQNLMLDFNL